MMKNSEKKEEEAQSETEKTGNPYGLTLHGITADMITSYNGLFDDRQISGELEWFRDSYGLLRPACLIIYDRVAYFEPGGDLRLTIDFNPRYRTDALNLTSSMDGFPLLPDGDTILEIKVQGAMPLWLTAILDDGQIFKTSFSKYGEAYSRQSVGPAELPGLRIAG